MKNHNYAKHDEFIDRGLEKFNLSETLLKEIKVRYKNSNNIKILEIGSGKGILLCQLNSMFENLELHGLNLNRDHGIKVRKDFIVNARKKGINLSTNNLPTIHFGNATKLKFKDNTFDIVISQVSFLHIVNKAKALEESYRILKPNGLALISLGSYSISVEKKDDTPYFYAKMNQSLNKDYNPRFLIRKNKKYIKISKFINQIRKHYDITLWSNNFISKTQKAKGFWLIVRKNINDRLDLKLKYLRHESKVLTSKYGKRNPVNSGAIDIYELK